MARVLPKKFTDYAPWQRALRDLHDEVLTQESEFDECLELTAYGWSSALIEELGKASGALLRRDTEGVRDGVLRVAGTAVRFLCWLDTRGA